MFGTYVSPSGSSSGTTVGEAFLNLTNPSAITFPRINADNTVTALTAANFLTAIGAAGLTTNAFTGAQTVTLAALGTTPTAGLSFINSTAAAAGAQQVSPSLIWEGKGWKTDATAASQSVNFRAYVLTVQGASAPTGHLTFDASINGGAYSTLRTVIPSDSNGVRCYSGVNWMGIESSNGYDLRVMHNAGLMATFNNVGNLNVTSLSLSGISFLYQLGANTLAQLSGTNAQTFYVCGTYTNSSNYVRASLAATSTSVTLAAETAGTGADDIDLTFTPSGTGVMKFGTHAGLAAETVTGYISIKDSGGTARKLAVVS